MAAWAVEWGVCCVCHWPIWTDMQVEHDGRLCFAVGYQETEAHPQCAPYRKAPK